MTALPAGTGGDLAGAHACGHAGNDLFGGERLALKELFHQGLVRFGNGFVHSLDQALKAVADIGHANITLAITTPPIASRTPII